MQSQEPPNVCKSTCICIPIITVYAKAYCSLSFSKNVFYILQVQLHIVENIKTPNLCSYYCVSLRKAVFLQNEIALVYPNTGLSTHCYHVQKPPLMLIDHVEQSVYF